MVDAAAAAVAGPDVVSDEVGAGPIPEVEVQPLLPTVQELPF